MFQRNSSRFPSSADGLVDVALVLELRFFQARNIRATQDFCSRICDNPANHLTNNSDGQASIEVTMLVVDC